MPAKRASVAKPKKAPLAPDAFFSGPCRRVLSIMKATCADLGGRYAIRIVDKDSDVAWTLDFPSASVVPGRDGVDLVVTLTPAQFASLSTGKVELKKLVADGAAPCEGDRNKLENVSLVLAFLERA